MATRTAGDPDDAKIVCTELSPTLLASPMATRGTPVCAEGIRHWLAAQALRLRKLAQDLAGGHAPDRATPCERIAALSAAYARAGHPSVSMDPKATEPLGKRCRAGRVRSPQAFRAFDHDCPRWADGGLIPHGMYARVRTRGPLNLGLSHDTSPCAGDRFRWYGHRIGKRGSPQATSSLWRCDCGGSHAANPSLCKHALPLRAEQSGVEMRVAHDPSSCSKYHLLERRLLPHLPRACQGLWFDTLDTVVTVMRKAATSTGLRTTGKVIRRHYETGRKATEHLKQNLKIVFDHLLPKWNYRALPQHATVIN